MNFLVVRLTDYQKSSQVIHSHHHKLHKSPQIRYSYRMKTKPLTFLLSLTFLFLFSSVVFGDDYQDGVDAYKRKDYKTAYKLWLPLAEQGNAKAQYNLGVMYAKGRGFPQDYILAHMWLNLSGANGYKRGIKLRNLAEKKMTASQIEKARELARNWKPTSK